MNDRSNAKPRNWRISWSYTTFRSISLTWTFKGAELKALRGLGSYLSTVDYIYAEVNSGYVYEGCCLTLYFERSHNMASFK